MSTPSISAFLSQAERCLDTYPPQEKEALTLYNEALRAHPTSSLALQLAGELHCSASDPSVRNEARGIELLRQSIALEPTGAVQRYFYLAQALASNASMAKEAEQVYQAGIANLQEELVTAEKSNESNAVLQEMREQMASAYCAIADLYMTDLCDTPGAQDRVEECLKQATAIHPDGFDAHATFAVYLKTIGHLEEAIRSAERAMETLRTITQQRERIESLTGLLRETADQESGNGDDDMEDQELPECPATLPSWEARLSLCACLIDLGKGEWIEEVTQTLMEEDNQRVDLWHVLACHNLALKRYDEARSCITIGQQLLTTALQATTGGQKSEGSGKEVATVRNYCAHWKNVLERLSENVEAKAASASPAVSGAEPLVARNAS